MGMDGLTSNFKDGLLSISDVKKTVLARDRDALLTSAMEHSSTALAAQIATGTSWLTYL